MEKDPEDDHHVVRMKDSLVFRNHICISFELLGYKLTSSFRLGFCVISGF